MAFRILYYICAFECRVKSKGFKVDIVRRIKMAVNSFNPRLFSSSSSENEVEDVFRHKAGAVVPVDVTLPSAKNRCFSEPGHQNGRGKKKQ